ncbi:NAD(P)H-binding protein [Levilactobacillus brevis]|nr:NAD(P)H-binding protein [Levilactobacillus brevis]
MLGANGQIARIVEHRILTEADLADVELTLFLRQADQLLAASDLDYTTLRLPWLNDRDEVAYTITTHDQPYDGVSGSRQSVADVMIKLISQPTLYQRESIGMANPATQGQSRPVY